MTTRMTTEQLLEFGDTSFGDHNEELLERARVIINSSPTPRYAIAHYDQMLDIREKERLGLNFNRSVTMSLTSRWEVVNKLTVEFLEQVISLNDQLSDEAAKQARQLLSLIITRTQRLATTSRIEQMGGLLMHITFYRSVLKAKISELHPSHSFLTQCAELMNFVTHSQVMDRYKALQHTLHEISEEREQKLVKLDKLMDIDQGLKEWGLKRSIVLYNKMARLHARLKELRMECDEMEHFIDHQDRHETETELELKNIRGSILTCYLNVMNYKGIEARKTDPIQQMEDLGTRLTVTLSALKSIEEQNIVGTAPEAPRPSTDGQAQPKRPHGRKGSRGGSTVTRTTTSGDDDDEEEEEESHISWQIDGEQHSKRRKSSGASTQNGSKTEEEVNKSSNRFGALDDVARDNGAILTTTWPVKSVHHSLTSIEQPMIPLCVAEKVSKSIYNSFHKHLKPPIVKSQSTERQAQEGNTIEVHTNKTNGTKTLTRHDSPPTKKPLDASLEKQEVQQSKTLVNKSKIYAKKNRSCNKNDESASVSNVKNSPRRSGAFGKRFSSLREISFSSDKISRRSMQSERFGNWSAHKSATPNMSSLVSENNLYKSGSSRSMVSDDKQTIVTKVVHFSSPTRAPASTKYFEDGYWDDGVFISQKKSKTITKDGHTTHPKSIEIPTSRALKTDDNNCEAYKIGSHSIHEYTSETARSSKRLSINADRKLGSTNSGLSFATDSPFIKSPPLRTARRFSTGSLLPRPYRLKPLKIHNSESSIQSRVKNIANDQTVKNSPQTERSVRFQPYATPTRLPAQGANYQTPHSKGVSSGYGATRAGKPEAPQVMRAERLKLVRHLCQARDLRNNCLNILANVKLGSRWTDREVSEE